MNVTTITAPTEEPITLAEAKAHLRVSTTEDDQYIDGLITAARQWAERTTRRAIVTQTLSVSFDFGFPCVVYLPRAPLISVTAASFVYLDTDGVSTQVPTATYTVDTTTEPGRVYEAYGQTWPTTRDVEKAVTCQFVAGYGAASAVPADLKAAIKLLVSQMYEFREPHIVGGAVSAVPMSVETILHAYRLPVV